MNIREHIRDQKLKVRVIPDAAKTEVREVKENVVKIALNAPARSGEANKELLKFLKKQGLKARILRGLKSRDKVVEIIE